MRMLSLALVIAGLAAPAPRAQTVTARVRMERPEHHFFQVEIVLRDFPGESLELVLPVWTPGSYKVRDYARHFESFQVLDGAGKPLVWEKVSKSRWRLEPRGAAEVVVRFDAFAHIPSVRESYLDDQQAFLSPPALFPYVEGYQNLAYRVELFPPEGWDADTGLALLSPGDSGLAFEAEDYDRLVDSPFLVGTHRRHDFVVDEVPFRFCVAGSGNMDETAMTQDMAKVVKAAGDLFGSFPFERYVFLTRFGGGGGLEHRDSTALMTDGWRYDSESGWNGFLGLVAHEFFHAWNVKRIRDRALGPFDYTQEVYTRLLWVHEGWTTYYTNVLLQRAGIKKAKALLESLEGAINAYHGRPGRRIQSLAEASFDAWIKFYQTNDTAHNSTVSYYSHGRLAAQCFDLILRHQSANERSLDDVMRRLDRDFGAHDVGFQESDLHDILIDLGGEEAREMWERCVIGTEDLDFSHYLSYAGLELELKKRKVPGEDGKPFERAELPAFGWATRSSGSSLTIRSLERGGTAWEAGFDLGDELIAVDDVRITSRNFDKLLQESLDQPGVDRLVARRGRLSTRWLPMEGEQRRFTLKKQETADALAQAIYLDLFGEPFKKEKEKEESDAEPAEDRIGDEQDSSR